MKLTSLIIISSSLIFGSSFAVNISPRVFGECVGISLHNILCFGGKSSNKEDATVYKDMYALSLRDFNGQSPNQIANSWSQIKGEMPIPNSDFLFFPVGPEEAMMVGGSGSISNSTTPFIYNMFSSTVPWRPASYPDLRSAIPPLRGSAVAMSLSDRGVIVGGATYGNVSNFFTDMISVKYDSIFKRISLTSMGSININRIGHSAIFETMNLYIIGGQQLVNNKLQSIPMNQVSQFNSLQSVWNIITFGGSIPSPRSYFTLTKSHIAIKPYGYILFGGINADTNIVSGDKMYMLNYAKNTYETRNIIDAPSARFGHSAINHNINNLIIVNGMDASGTALSDFHVYDIKGNVWVSNFSSSGIYQASAYEDKVPRYGPDHQKFGWGFFAGVFALIHLTGFGFYRYVQKKSPHHETNVNVDSSEIKESDQYNEQNNNYNYQSASPSTDQYNGNSIYQLSSLPISSSPPIDHRPLPPTPVMSMPTGPQYSISSSPIFYQQDLPYPQRQ